MIPDEEDELTTPVDIPVDVLRIDAVLQQAVFILQPELRTKGGKLRRFRHDPPPDKSLDVKIGCNSTELFAKGKTFCYKERG